MSSNKAAEQPHGPKCSRCGYHGIIVRIKGHRKECPFLHCHCWKCDLIVQRSRIDAAHRRTNGQSRDQRLNRQRNSDGPATDEADTQPRGAVGTPAEAPETVAASDCCPLDLRTRPPASRGGVKEPPEGEYRVSKHCFMALVVSCVDMHLYCAPLQNSD